MPDDSVWEDIRHAYETSPLTIKKLIATYNITERQLQQRREAECWPPRDGVARMQAAARAKRAEKTSSPPVSVAASSPGAPPKTTRSNKTPPKTATATGRKALITRLATAIDRKLVTLERRMERELDTLDDLDDASAADIERDIRAIGQLIKNLEQATAHDATATQKAGGASSRKRGRDVSAAELADTADGHRRELLNRLQRLVDAAKPPTGSDPGGVETG